MPLLIALISIVGLFAALLGNGPGDVISWVALLVPVAVMLRHLLQRTPH